MRSIVIRADASPQIGSGHVARMESLAAALRARGAAICFAAAAMPEKLAARLGAAGHGFAMLPEVEAAVPSSDAVIVDHYALGAEWEHRARAQSPLVIAIDDLARAHDCDILLDQNLGATELAYRPQVPSGAALLIGPRYALLRDEFRAFVASPARERAEVRRIMVSMGGYDEANATAHVLRGLSLLRNGVAVDVLLPHSAPHAEAVASLCANHGFAYAPSESTVSSLMESADLAVGAAGGTAWERCLLGLPTLAITVAKNQRPGAVALAKAGAARWLGELAEITPGQLMSEVCAVASDPSLLQAMSRAARAVMQVDGDPVFSTDRAADAIMERLCA